MNSSRMASTRASRVRFAGTTMVLWLTAGMAGTGAADPASPRPATLPIRLLTTSEMPEMARRSMRAEVERIWQQAGVSVRWCPWSSGVAHLRLIVRERGVSDVASAERFALAQFHRREVVIMASLAAGWRAVRAGLEHADNTSWPVHRSWHALGVALGRAVAHEVGHYLLGPAHTGRGLMRSTFGVRELVDPRAARDFVLDGRNARRLRQRIETDSRLTHQASGVGQTCF